MIIQGPNIERQIRQNFGKVRAAMLICEVLMFNSVIMSRTSGLSSVRHSTIHDVSLPKDITMKLHALTRQTQLIDMFHYLGLAVYYDRYSQLSTDAGNTVRKTYDDNHIACPPSLKKNVFMQPWLIM